MLKKYARLHAEIVYMYVRTYSTYITGPVSTAFYATPYGRLIERSNTKILPL